MRWQDGTENVIVIKYWQIHPTSETFNIKTRKPSWHFRCLKRAFLLPSFNEYFKYRKPWTSQHWRLERFFHGPSTSSSSSTALDRRCWKYCKMSVPRITKRKIWPCMCITQKFGRWKNPDFILGVPCAFLPCGELEKKVMTCLSLITTFSWDFLDKTIQILPSKETEPRLWWWQQRLAPAAPVWSVNVRWCDPIRQRVTGRIALCCWMLLKVEKGSHHELPPPPENQHDNGTSDIWRCISYWTWRFSNVMVEFQRCIMCHLFVILNDSNFVRPFDTQVAPGVSASVIVPRNMSVDPREESRMKHCSFLPSQKTWQFDAVDGSEIRKKPVEVGSLSHYFEGFRHCWWLFGISSINTFIIVFQEMALFALKMIQTVVQAMEASKKVSNL